MRYATEPLQVPEDRYLISAIESLPGDPDQMWRVYVGPRWAGRYVLLSTEVVAPIWDALMRTPILWAVLKVDQWHWETKEERQERMRKDSDQLRSDFYRVENAMLDHKRTVSGRE